MMEDIDEATLIEHILQGGTNSYEELVKRYHVGLIIHCEQLVHDRDQAEDIAQDAFIKAFNKLSEFDSQKGRFSTWLYKIATNCALDELRKKKRQLVVDDIESLMDPILPDYAEFEERDAVRRAVADLMPPHYRMIIEAYFWQGKSYAEIAEEQKVPVSTIGTWIRRAKSQLKEALA